jgi:hypothetical protein
MSPESMSELKYMCATVAVHNEVDDEIIKNEFRIKNRNMLHFC